MIRLKDADIQELITRTLEREKIPDADGVSKKIMGYLHKLEKVKAQKGFEKALEQGRITGRPKRGERRQTA